MARELWVTDRCVREDLRLTSPDDTHPLIAKFVALRAQDAEPAGEHISGTRPRTLFKVDANEHGAIWRGATWYDRKNEVVYLVAAGQHRSGARDDFYARLPQRLTKIYPAKVDLEQVLLAATEREVRNLRERIVPELLTLARENGSVVRWLKHCRVRLLVQREGDDAVNAVYALRLDPLPNDSLDVKVAVATAQVFSRVVDRPMTQSDRQWGEDKVPRGCFVFYF